MDKGFLFSKQLVAHVMKKGWKNGNSCCEAAHIHTNGLCYQCQRSCADTDINTYELYLIQDSEFINDMRTPWPVFSRFNTFRNPFKIDATFENVETLS